MQSNTCCKLVVEEGGQLAGEIEAGFNSGLLPGLSAVLLAAPVRSALPSPPLLQRQARKLVTLG